MRINRYVALASGLSRRVADRAIAEGRVKYNGRTAINGQSVSATDQILLDGIKLIVPKHLTTILLNKPPGYVVSRKGQGNPTVYDLLPPQFSKLKPVGRLDKTSEGLLLLTNDGSLANRLAHPGKQKLKLYSVTLDRPLSASDAARLTKTGVKLDDGVSRLGLKPLSTDKCHWQVSLHEGRNRQIRRSFSALGYTVVKLKRTKFGEYNLAGIASGQFRKL